MSSLPKAQAIKNTDGSYTVRVFYLADRYSEVVFPHDSQTEQLALEYVDFKNQQRVSGPHSPATQAVLADYRAMQAGDEHEKLIETALPKLTKVGPAPVVEVPAAVVNAPEIFPVSKETAASLGVNLEESNAHKATEELETIPQATAPAPAPTSPTPVQSAEPVTPPAAPTVTAATEPSAQE